LAAFLNLLVDDMLVLLHHEFVVAAIFDEVRDLLLHVVVL
jgi:hypothetical protein